MVSKNTATLAPIDEDLRDKFRATIKERYGRIRGPYRDVLEQLVEEWIEHGFAEPRDDQLDQIHEELAALRSEVDALSSETEPKKKKDSTESSKHPSDVQSDGPGPRVSDRLKKIEEEIQRESDGKSVHRAVVKEKIMEIAGGSDPTINQYMEHLTDTRTLYPNPVDDNKFFVDGEEFVQAVESFNVNGALPDSIVEDYMDVYGRNWWQDRMPNLDGSLDESGKGFQ